MGRLNEMPPSQWPLSHFLHIAGPNAACTDHDPFHLALVFGSYALKVRIETTAGGIVSMADIIAEQWFFSTYFAYFGHDYILLSRFP